jgi:hypothetical protein
LSTIGIISVLLNLKTCESRPTKSAEGTGALDNFDHDPSSTLAQGSFHGTGMSISQFPTASDFGIEREQIVIDEVSAGKCSLSESAESC